MTSPHLKAVIFDIGGVVIRSPFIPVAEYEKELGVPPNYLNCSIGARGKQGAWQRFERGEIPLFAFYQAFGSDLSDVKNNNVWYMEYCKRRGIECPKLPESLDVNGRELFGRMMRGGMLFDDHMLKAIRRLRDIGKWRIIALTNNFTQYNGPSDSPLSSRDANAESVAVINQAAASVPLSELEFLGWQEGPTPPRLRALFDDFCDSSTLGMRKPEPDFFLLACKRNEIQPEQAVFLDDIGMNLKAASKLGMETIHVPLGGTLNALKTLEGKLGVDLTSSPKGDSTMCPSKL
ncbi:hypothetical protein SERLA73DRAFT_185594 [Serpula lacrymans var. lacrymans S7.3]|uniref:Epoxide hydrolase n=2 Tax=Serpula lacrymans var. lacrymans TaxID=341189 RepID=F8Q634_SERL3|nr:uncharacterized protein SERLADRAFT_474154 [Serpula lacrymans var. lacrymans S7.9]EGN96072.1 hypothetical protein SERLA73DRAFT_185594 [Serpula lacrymans var. lacrymans S7.3]EGO21593.1 hypothetical protein SERLADRAFT_474154 [Serpula lacrymans var. lacrymans S7.9]